MKQTLALAVALVAAASSLARADRPRPTYRWYTPSAAHATPVVPGVSHVIYMNNCQPPNNCTLHPGDNDATMNYSSIPNSTTTISGYTGSAANWAALVQCVRSTYAPFDVQIVDTRPASGDYHMAIVAGTPQQVGEGNGVLGVSPFDCDYIPNSVSFTFANLEPTNIEDLCWTVSQETAHSWGLDHKFDNRDPMTYLSSGPTHKTFQNAAGSCGEYSARTCSCQYAVTGSAAMNSYALIMATFGSSAPDTTPPVVTITSPANGANPATAPITVTATVTDDVSVAKAELRVDGVLLNADTQAPFSWTTSATLGQGAHHLEVKGYDGANNTATNAIDITIGMVCHSPSDCPNEGDTCVDGRCVAGMGEQGGLGAVCATNADCASGQCGDDGGGHKYCVETCDPSMNGCPSGFGCIAANGAGVCWPGADSGGGGGCATHDNAPLGPVLLGLGLAIFVARRRK